MFSRNFILGRLHFGSEIQKNTLLNGYFGYFGSEIQKNTLLNGYFGYFGFAREKTQQAQNEISRKHNFALFYYGKSIIS